MGAEIASEEDFGLQFDEMDSDKVSGNCVLDAVLSNKELVQKFKQFFVFLGRDRQLC